MQRLIKNKVITPEQALNKETYTLADFNIYLYGGENGEVIRIRARSQSEADELYCKYLIK